MLILHPLRMRLCIAAVGALELFSDLYSKALSDYDVFRYDQNLRPNKTRA